MKFAPPRCWRWTQNANCSVRYQSLPTKLKSPFLAILQQIWTNPTLAGSGFYDSFHSVHNILSDVAYVYIGTVIPLPLYSKQLFGKDAQNGNPEKRLQSIWEKVIKKPPVNKAKHRNFLLKLHCFTTGNDDGGKMYFQH